MAAKTTVRLDFTNVKEGGNFTKKRVKSGDYLGKVTKLDIVPIKGGEHEGKDQACYTIEIKGRHGASYPYYCQFHEKALWKLRNLLVAAGKNVPKRKTEVDLKSPVGKTIGMTLDDADYDGREQSEITAVFPASEVDGAEDDDVEDDVDDDEEEDDEEDEEEEEEAPKPAKKRAKKAPEPEEEDDDEEEEEEDEEEEDEEPEPPKKRAKKRKPAPVEDDEDDDDDELEVDDL